MWSVFNKLNETYENKEKIFKDNTDYILTHKLNVLKSAQFLKENLPELFNDINMEEFDNLIAEHDNSKFSDAEFEPYAEKWFGNGEKTEAYELAWEHHWKTNKHHPEYWNGNDMEYIYILEMICDWLSFGFTKNDLSDIINFYYNSAINDEEKNLSKNTKQIVEYILDLIEPYLTKSDILKESFKEDNIVDFIKHSTTEQILAIIHDGGNITVQARPTKQVDARVHLFILPDGRTINMNHYNTDYHNVISLNNEEDFNQTHDYLPACISYVNSIKSGSTIKEANDKIFNQMEYFEEAVAELVNSLGWIRYNCGADLISGNYNSKGYIHLPKNNITRQQLYTLQTCIEYNEMQGIPFNIFVADGTALWSKDYELASGKNPLFAEDVIQEIWEYYKKQIAA